MKLELKYLAAYLPYELKVLFEHRPSFKSHPNYFKTEKLSASNISIIGKKTYSLVSAKPILRPLSDLTKEITHNGESFVPAGKMITHGFHNSFWYETDKFDYRYLYSYDLDKLLEWHFDVFGLIGKGLAVDINTLQQ